MMAVITDGDKGDFKDKQFAETEIADKVLEQCKCALFILSFTSSSREDLQHCDDNRAF